MTQENEYDNLEFQTKIKLHGNKTTLYLTIPRNLADIYNFKEKDNVKVIIRKLKKRDDKI